MAGLKMEAEIIFEPHVPSALRRALEYAGDDGFVAPREVATSLRNLDFER